MIGKRAVYLQNNPEIRCTLWIDALALAVGPWCIKSDVPQLNLFFFFNWTSLVSSLTLRTMRIDKEANLLDEFLSDDQRDNSDFQKQYHPDFQ